MKAIARKDVLFKVGLGTAFFILTLLTAPRAVGQQEPTSNELDELDTTPVELSSPDASPELSELSAPKKVEIQGLDFKYGRNQSNLEIKMDGTAQVEKTVSEADQQVILEVKNATLPQRLAKKIDASSYRSNVRMVSPYQNGDDVRIVFQMKNNADVNLVQNGTRLSAQVTEGTPASASIAANTSSLGAESPKEDLVLSSNDSPESLENFLEAQKTKQYRGRKIFLRMTDADIRDVFRAVSEASEFSIVVSDDVKGRITVNLDQVPWDQALDILLHSNRLAAERTGSVLRVTTLDALTNEKIAEETAKKVAEAVEPLVLKIFPISYAKLDDLKRILDEFLSKETLPNQQPQKRGAIQVDQRTNSLVVKETPTNMEKIKRIIQELDAQTPQILIEAKFVEVNERRNKDVQGRIFSTSREYDSASNQFGFRNHNNFGSLFGGTSFGGANNAAGNLATSFAVTPFSGASFGFQPRAGLIPGLREIAAFLSILESESSAKIIASPRVITQNKEQAEISQGQTIQLPTAAGANASGAFITVNAVLRLQVVPQVTNEGTVNLRIAFSQEAPSASASTNFTTDTKRVDTSVLIDSGSTLVIGGIYSSNVRTAEGGIPFLRNIPIIGALFGSKRSDTEKNELFIFLTPRILNEKESGIRG